MPRTIATGIQDFNKLIKNDCFYVDKTSFIKEWWESRDDVTLITRPRRFGKTLLMNMLNDFFSVSLTDRRDLFKNLNIWKEESYRNLQGTYPVIFLSFGGVKGTEHEISRKIICQLLANLYADHRYLLKSGFLDAQDAAFFERVSVDMDDADAALSIVQLSRYLYRYYGKKVIILLDGYDSPIQEAYTGGYWNEMTDFTRSLFNATFKTNPYLERAVLTGVTRVSKESVFSDLNNLAVIPVTSRKYETSFGFTEEEVFQALAEFGLESEKEEVKRWYDGFRFGECDSIYNPWSITRFLDEKAFAAYWANTSSNRLAGKLIQKGSKKIKIVTEDLLAGKSFCAAIDEQAVFSELDYSEDAVWSLLLAGGYLKIAGYEIKDQVLRIEGLLYRLTLTNLENALVFRKMVRGWFAVCGSSYNDFIKALLAGDLESMNGYMNRVALAVFSSFDCGKKPSETSEPERFYHGFVLGLMVDLADRYEITSNRESGFGRYDVLLKPRSSRDDGLILEFKVIQPGKEKNLKETAASAVRQILERKYAAVLEEKCKEEQIRVYGLAFRGKKVLIDGGYIRDLENRVFYTERGSVNNG